MFENPFLSCVCSNFGYLNCIVNTKRSSLKFHVGVKLRFLNKKFGFEYIT
jgi:hypothetical protein